MNPDDEGEIGLAIRAAWLHHAGGLTQTDVAHRLHLSPLKTHRLIARAARLGYVHVFVDGPIGGCVELEQGLQERFALQSCRVVPGLDQAELPLRALGLAAASFLQNVLDTARHRQIGVGHGRTLAAMAGELPRRVTSGVRFISLLGGLPRSMAATPYDVIYRLADKTSAEAYLMSVPFFARSAADCAVMMAQEGVAETIAAAAKATLFLVGIGEVTGRAFLPTASALVAREFEELAQRGAAGELLGRYLDSGGSRIDTQLHAQVVGLDPEAMRGREAIAIAGGTGKVGAIRAVLRSRLLTGLITDEATARSLLVEGAG